MAKTTETANYLEIQSVNMEKESYFVTLRVRGSGCEMENQHMLGEVESWQPTPQNPGTLKIHYCCFINLSPQPYMTQLPSYYPFSLPCSHSIYCIGA